jgi:tetratricopeptide (TPR) repeat protein
VSARGGRGWRAVLSLLLGTVVALALAEGALRLFGATYLRRQAAGNVTPERDGVRTVLCLGESSTALWGEDAYPRQLEAVLNGRGVGRFRVVNGGLPGISSRTIIANLDANLDRYRPDVVTAMMGINDDKPEFAALGEPDGETRPSLLQRLKLYRLVTFARLDARRQAEARRHQAEVDAKAAALRARLAAADDAATALELAALLREAGRCPEAEPVFVRLLERHPSPAAYEGLARCYRALGREDDLLRTQRQAVRAFPRDHLTRYYLMVSLRQRGLDAEAEAALAEQARDNPDVVSYLELGDFCLGQRRWADAERWYRAALAVQPSDYAYARLAEIRQQHGDLPAAELLLQQALAVSDTGAARTRLALVYEQLGRLPAAEQALRQALAGDPRRWRFARAVVRAQGRAAEANAVLERLTPNRLSLRSYRRLTDTVMQRVGRLAVIQYPTRSLAPLRLLVPSRPGVVLVDNEESFRRAIATEGYHALFVDNYGGDFGHCTRRGNRLIAENVADVLVRTWFTSPAR